MVPSPIRLKAHGVKPTPLHEASKFLNRLNWPFFSGLSLHLSGRDWSCVVSIPHAVLAVCYQSFRPSTLPLGSLSGFQSLNYLPRLLHSHSPGISPTKAQPTLVGLSSSLSPQETVNTQGQKPTPPRPPLKNHALCRLFRHSKFGVLLFSLCFSMGFYLNKKGPVIRKLQGLV